MFMNEETRSFKNNMQNVWQWAYRLRSVLLALPVAIAAVILAIRNYRLLPDLVVLDMAKSSGGVLVFQTVTMSRNMAVVMPLLITTVCLLLMFCSKKVVYPWLISLFSLVFPIALQLLNTFP